MIALLLAIILSTLVIAAWHSLHMQTTGTAKTLAGWLIIAIGSMAAYAVLHLAFGGQKAAFILLAVLSLVGTVWVVWRGLLAKPE